MHTKRRAVGVGEARLRVALLVDAAQKVGRAVGAQRARLRAAAAEGVARERRRRRRALCVRLAFRDANVTAARRGLADEVGAAVRAVRVVRAFVRWRRAAADGILDARAAPAVPAVGAAVEVPAATRRAAVAAGARVVAGAAVGARRSTGAAARDRRRSDHRECRHAAHAMNGNALRRRTQVVAMKAASRQTKGSSRCDRLAFGFDIDLEAASCRRREQSCHRSFRARMPIWTP